MNSAEGRGEPGLPFEAAESHCVRQAAIKVEHQTVYGRMSFKRRTRTFPGRDDVQEARLGAGLADVIYPLCATLSPRIVSIAPRLIALRVRVL